MTEKNQRGVSYKMRKNKIIIMTIIVMILLTGRAYSSVRIESGYYIIEGATGEAETREQARKVLYRNAIEVAMEKLVPGISSSNNYEGSREKVLNKQSSLIKNFKITNETKESGRVKLTGEVRISEKNLDNILGPEIIKMLGNPRIMIITDEKVGDKAPFISTTETEALRIFERAGYLLVDPGQAKALLQLEPSRAFNDPGLLTEAARTLRADIIIVGRAIAGAFAKQKIHGITLYGVSGTVQLKAILTRTAYQISSKTISSSTGKKPAQSISGGADRCFRNAAITAAEQIVYKIAYGLASASSALGGITVNVKVSGVNFRDVEEIESHLKEYAGTNGNIFERSYEKNVLELDIVSEKSARNIASFLSDYVEIEGMTTQTITASKQRVPIAAVQKIQEITEPPVVINIYIDRIRRYEDSEPIERSIREFVGISGDVKGEYAGNLLKLTVTYAPGLEDSDRKDVQLLATFLRDKDIKVDKVAGDSITGWKQGGWLW